MALGGNGFEFGIELLLAVPFTRTGPDPAALAGHMGQDTPTRTTVEASLVVAWLLGV